MRGNGALIFAEDIEITFSAAPIAFAQNYTLYPDLIVGRPRHIRRAGSLNFALHSSANVSYIDLAGEIRQF